MKDGGGDMIFEWNARDLNQYASNAIDCVQ